MRIENFDIKEQGDTVEVSADVDSFRLWFRVPQSYQVARTGDTFLAAALLPAMLRGENIEIDPLMPVSPKLLKNVQLLQEIHHCWNPVFKIVSVSARTSPSAPLNGGVMSFFSGGVDSMYTFLKHTKEISHVIFMQGMDFYYSNTETSTFSVGDLKDLAHFAVKLSTAQYPISAFLKGRLSKMTLQLLSNYLNSGSDSGALEVSLLNDLNKIVAGQLIYEAKRFGDVKLRPQTRELLAYALQGDDLIDLNRLLLEDAYPLQISRKDSGSYQKATERNTCFVQSFGKTLIPVENNHYAFGYRYNLGRNLTQGSVLASVALLLGFPRVYVPSAFSYSQLIPLGSHPLTDLLYSNECVEIIHDGAEARRVDKVRKIAECESALANLRVCIDDVNVNCGKCSKCLRTMIPLKLLGVSSAPFPPLPPLKSIRKMRIGGDIEMIFFKENCDLGLLVKDVALRDALYACMQRYERIKLFKEIDRVLLGGLIKRAYRRIVKDQPVVRRIDSTPPID
jgi:hypothetical protein